jgi:hypothetical protein
MYDRSKSETALAQLARLNCVLEAERNALFDALSELVSHMKLTAAGPAGLQTALVCGRPVDDRRLEAALRHAQFVLHDELTAAAARASRAGPHATALQ